MDIDDLLLDVKIWADRRSRAFDVPTMRTLLALRSTYDETAATSWPAGSVSDLLTSLWPAKGDGTVLDEDVLRSSFDTFLRFLRNTGAMTGRSAPLADLQKEVRSAVRGINDRAADRTHWSIGKQMMDFADQIGLGITEGDDVESVRASLEATQARWNALPVHERRALSPDPATLHLSGFESARRAYGSDDVVQMVILSMRYELPTGELPDASALAPTVRSSGLLRELLRFHAALDDSERITGTGVLPVARARELIEELGLPDAGGWRSSRDATALHRLWEAATWSGLLTFHATVAHPRPLPDLTDDDVAVRITVGAFVGAFFSTLRYLSDGAGLTYVLLRSYVTERRIVSWAELAGFLDDWMLSPRSREHGTSVADIHVARTRHHLEAVADSGAVVVDDAGVRLTAFGDVAVTALLGQLEKV